MKNERTHPVQPSIHLLALVLRGFALLLPLFLVAVAVAQPVSLETPATVSSAIRRRGATKCATSRRATPLRRADAGRNSL